MEVQPGMFVSNVGTDAWRTDPEVPGSEMELGVGDMASIPAGLTTTWHVRTPFKEMWVLAAT